tara:strand:+ start:449 stop:571 length:123 start_codon:yes stop_codon:yes gene_type:complete
MNEEVGAEGKKLSLIKILKKDIIYIFIQQSNLEDFKTYSS